VKLELVTGSQVTHIHDGGKSSCDLVDVAARKTVAREDGRQRLAAPQTIGDPRRHRHQRSGALGRARRRHRGQLADVTNTQPPSDDSPARNG